MGATLAIGGMIATFAGILGGTVWYSRKVAARRELVWRAVAQELNGEYIRGAERFFGRETDRVFVSRPGVSVVLDSHVVQRGKHSYSYTRIVSRFAAGSGPSFKFTPDNVLLKIGNRVGLTKDLELGHAAFDKKFAVSSPHSVDVLRRALGSVDSLLTAMVESHDKATLDTSVNDIKLEWMGLSENRGELCSAIEVVATIASLGVDAFRAATSFTSAPGATSAMDESAAGTITFQLTGHQGRPVLLASIRSERANLPNFAAQLGHGPPEIPDGILTQNARPLLSRIGEAKLSLSHNELRLLWDAIPDASVARAGRDLLKQIASEPRGFR